MAVPGRERAALIALFFGSGAAALIYQVLWVRELGLLFGATAEAAAVGIAVFFAGIALGGWIGGWWASRLASPLRAFGLVELGVAATALGHFLVADAYFALVPVLHEAAGARPLAETALKLAVAATILLPSAVLMGMTLPLMGQHLIRAPGALGREAPLLYAANTAGGAAGAIAAGFALPPLLGFAGSYLLAVALDAAIGLAALWLARGTLPRRSPRAAATAAGARDALPAMLRALAFLSGAATLAVEVVWTRIFAQVLQNSVYTYALVLTAFLMALALGALLARAVGASRRIAPRAALAWVLAASALLLAAMPHGVHLATGGLGYVGRDAGFGGYVVQVAGLVAGLVLLPGAVLGAVLPLLLRLARDDARAAGAVLGRLVAVNTAGAILGALAAGFVLLPLAGAARALWLIAALYLALAAAAAPRGAAVRGAALAGAALLVLARPDLPAVTLDPTIGETLVELREGRAANVAVVESGGARFIRVNNHYTLGGSATLVPERNQAMIALLLHPDPQDVFFLGLGTGITAGAALFAEPVRVTVCELLPEVVALARRHFAPYANGLFDDPRVTIHAADGRHCLARSRARHDVIVADLFTPWEAGTGSLYTLEHYRLAARRLAPGGIYVQWLPLYQVSRRELAIIANTMAQVFPELTFWRGDFFPGGSILALVGRMEPVPLDPAVLARQWRRMTGSAASDAELARRALAFHAGNAASDVFADAPLNTDDRPRIEYMAPRTQRAVAAGRTRWLTGTERDALLGEIAAALPPARDPHLALLSKDDLVAIERGRLFSAWLGLLHEGRDEEADAVLDRLLAQRGEVRPRPSSPAEETADARPR